jgi:hypothetical protein
VEGAGVGNNDGDTGGVEAEGGVKDGNVDRVGLGTATAVASRPRPVVASREVVAAPREAVV